MVQEVEILFFFSAGEASGLTGKQKRLVEMLEEIKAMRETKR
jgi:hypothetical protein